MKKCQILIFLYFLLYVSTIRAQVTDFKYYNYGIWQTFGQPVSRQNYPETRGRLCNFRWADIETSPGVWDWADFEYELSIRVADSLPVIFMVYTGQDAPEWLYRNGVPKVEQRDFSGQVSGYSPYYADEDYKFYFKRMISTVRDHINTLPENVRSQIVAVQACFGSTGDYISYKGAVASEYYLSRDDFDALFEEFSKHYYNEYKNTSPKIYLLSNPSNSGSDQMEWLIDNCPGGWIKTGSLGKGYQLNDEAGKASWLYNILNYPQDDGHYVRARCEITGEGLYTGWWSKSYRNMFALLCYDIHWGLDWSNQANQYLFDHNYDSAFFFYNRYAGEKIPGKSNYAMCALKDVIDASDVTRFPEAIYGPATRTVDRFKNVITPFKKYGALLEDPANAILSENDNLNAKGINDVGWNLFGGNYERFLHQIDPNGTSVGYWNVSSNDPISMYGRFARGFDTENEKDQMYFDVDDAFLNNTSIGGAYPVIIEIVYLDKGTGSWKLWYDSKTAPNKSSIEITCTNTDLWKKAVVNLTDANFGNRGPRNSDFNIKSLNGENVIFSVVELARPNKDLSGIGLFSTSLTPFDTICVNAVSEAKSFTLSGAFLTTSTVMVGPLKGYKFSETIDGVYENSLTIKGINSVFSKTMYIKFYPAEQGAYYDNILVKGDGKPLEIPVLAVAVNSSPQLNANIKSITCYNDRDGAIDLNLTGGTGPFTFSWTNNTNNSRPTSEDIRELTPAVYTVVVKSQAGCSVTAFFNVIQPEPVETVLNYDPMLCKGGLTNLYVTATGGITPYNGTGTFRAGPGYQVYTVTDANGCTDNNSVNIPNGTSTQPVRPESISSPKADETGVCGPGSFTYSIESIADATFYTWYPPAGSSITQKGNGTSAVLTTDKEFDGGELSVAAGNACGSSKLRMITIPTEPGAPQNIAGPANVNAKEEGLNYSVDRVQGLTYTWTLPAGAAIISGQASASIKVNWGNFSGNIRVSASNDCGASSNSAYYVTISTTAVTAQESSAAAAVAVVVPAPLLVYPNPAHDNLKLSFSASKSGDCKTELTDVTGRLLMRNTFKTVKGNNNFRIDLKPFTNGIYLLMIITETGEKKTVKIVKD